MPPLDVVERPNRLLGLLSAADRGALEGSMQQIPFGAHDMLHRPGEQMRYVYFPIAGVISVMTTLKEGEAIETATVGFEGMVGLQVFLGGAVLGNTQAMGQVPGQTWRIEAD